MTQPVVHLRRGGVSVVVAPTSDGPAALHWGADLGPLVQRRPRRSRGAAHARPPPLRPRRTALALGGARLRLRVRRPPRPGGLPPRRPVGSPGPPRLDVGPRGGRRRQHAHAGRARCRGRLGGRGRARARRRPGLLRSPHRGHQPRRRRPPPDRRPRRPPRRSARHRAARPHRPLVQGAHARSGTRSSRAPIARDARHGRTGHDATLLLVAGTPGFGFGTGRGVGRAHRLERQPHDVRRAHAGG